MKMGQLKEKLWLLKESERQKLGSEKCVISYEGVTVKLKGEDQQMTKTD